MRQLLIVVFAFGLCASPAVADQASQSASAAPPAPAAQTPKPSGTSRLKAGVHWIEGKLGGGDESKDGFYAEFGGLPSGSGISAGPGFRHTLFDGHARVDASTGISWSRGKFGQATFELPGLAGDHLRIGAQVKGQDFTRISYFGVGETSLEADRTLYGLQNTDYNAFAALKAHNGLTVAGRFGFSQHVDIVRSNSSSFPSTEDLFTEATAPGLVEHPSFLHGDVYVGVDTRNHPARPTIGGDYRVTLSTFSDRDFDRHSFRRVEAEASQYIPIPNQRWVIALRGRVAASDTATGNVIPFYLLPTLGGSTSLRGYNDYRFRDRNLLLLNAEYRWPILRALDGAVFYDAGKVTPRFGDLSLADLKTSYGVGFRFHAKNTTFFRVDVGHSQEGTRLLVSFRDVFRPGHGSIFIPYVP